MAINLTKIIDQIQTRLDDSTQSDRSIDQLIKIANRIDNSGTQVLSYKSTGQLPSTADSAYVGTIAYVETDNVFGDSSGRFVFASGRDSGWLKFTTIQDSDEAAIEAPDGTGGDIPTTPYQGTNFGYLAGGLTPYKNNIEKYSYTSDGDATDVGDLTVARSDGVGQSSSTNGYVSGGLGAGPASYNTIDKWTFPSDANATDVGNLTQARNSGGGASSTTHGYTATGTYDTSPYYTNVIDKFPFSSDGDATDVGDAAVTVYYTAGQNSTENGYVSGGDDGSRSNVIQKYPLSSDGNSSDIADLTETKRHLSGSSSTTHGYVAGGNLPPPGTSLTNVIEKFTFAADADATDVGDLDQENWKTAGTSSSTHGYFAGALPNTGHVIGKYSFATDGNSTDVGDLVNISNRGAGAQY